MTAVDHNLLGDAQIPVPAIDDDVIDLRPVPFVDLSLEHDLIRDALDRAVRAVVEKGDFILGEAVHRFEDAFARYCEADHAVGVDSGFSALELILRGLDIGPGDEVIVPANTFVATAAAVESCGARPVIVDMDPATYNIDPDRVAAAVGPRTRAIIPVHLYGQPAEMDRIAVVAARHGLAVIEDACQAHGARFRGARTGSLATAAAFSFYPSKNLGAFGDGGAVVTNDRALADRLRSLRNLGSTRKYHHAERGFNRRLDTLHAAVLEVKLGALDASNQSRRDAAHLYEHLLGPTPLVLPATLDHGDHVFHLYVVQVDDRSSLQAYLHDEGIATGIHYPVPIHLQEGYRSLGYGPGDFPVTEAAAARILSLPIFGRMPASAVIRTSQAILSYFGI
jgi:dTDP-4-amino-4,6-dideoxygalactose transaminase